jgi:hypothetical protein
VDQAVTQIKMTYDPYTTEATQKNLPRLLHNFYPSRKPRAVRHERQPPARVDQYGKIKAAMVMNNLVVVNEDEVRDNAQTLRKEDLPEYKKFAHLTGQSIWLSEASRLYNIPQQTISRWVQMGIIKKLEPSGNKVMIDQADMAYCAEIYHSRQTKQGRRLFEKNGLPYKPKTGPLSSQS